MVIDSWKVNKKKFLIVNADDFGFSPGINRGIILAFKEGIVRSTSLMINTPYTLNAARLSRENPTLDVGLHVVLPPEIIRRKKGYKLFEKEIETQVLKFISLFGANPSHMDFHGGFQFNKELVFATKIISARYKLRNRDGFSNLVIPHFNAEKKGKVDYQAVSVAALSVIISRLEPGLTELICHPGVTSRLLKDSYSTARNRELEALTSPEIFGLIKKEGIFLVNHKQSSSLGFDWKGGEGRWQ